MIEVVKKGTIFLILLLIQLLLIDQLDLGSFNYYFSPIIYGLVIILIHPGFDFRYLLIAAFVMGFSIDVFRNTMGLNISSLVAVAYLRKFILVFISPRDGFDLNKDLNIINIGLSRFLIYTGIMLVIHHLWFYILEDFHFNQIHIVFFRAFINSFIALAIIVLFQYLTFRKN